MKTLFKTGMMVMCVGMMSAGGAWGQRGGNPLKQFGQATVDAMGDLEFAAEFGWDSRYITEGRDNLEGDSLAGSGIEAGFKGVAVGIWQGSSPGVDYREVNASATYTHAWEAWEASAGYTYLDFSPDDADDHEMGASAIYTALPVQVGLEGYYSFEAEGTFIEFGVGGDYAVGSRLVLQGAGVLGINAGYVVEGHDGLNNASALLKAVIPVREGIEFSAYMAYTWGIDADPAAYADDELLHDVAFGGVSLALTQ